MHENWKSKRYNVACHCTLIYAPVYIVLFNGGVYSLHGDEEKNTTDQVVKVDDDLQN